MTRYAAMFHRCAEREEGAFGAFLFALEMNRLSPAMLADAAQRLGLRLRRRVARASQIPSQAPPHFPATWSSRA